MLEHPANYNASIVKERHGLMHLTNVLKDFMSIKKQKKERKAHVSHAGSTIMAST
jgi:hypothetical protein